MVGGTLFILVAEDDGMNSMLRSMNVEMPSRTLL